MPRLRIVLPLLVLLFVPAAPGAIAQSDPSAGCRRDAAGNVVPGRCDGTVAAIPGVGPDGQALPGWHFADPSRLASDPRCSDACQAYFRTHPIPDDLAYRRRYLCSARSDGETICGQLGRDQEF